MLAELDSLVPQQLLHQLALDNLALYKYKHHAID